MTHAPAALSTCPNCGRALDGAYCAGCGQKVAPINPTLHDFLHDFTHELLHVDGRIFQSVRLLLTRPGHLTREYFEGRRARHVSPIRLYLIFSLIYFATAAMVPKAPGDGVRLTVNDAEDDAELRRMGFGSAQELQDQANLAIQTWAPRAMFVLVPLFALFVKAVTRGTGRNYPQHLYFAFHVHAAAFAFLTVAGLARNVPIPIVAAIIALGIMTAIVVHVVRAFRCAYGGTTARAIGRTAVVGVCYMFAVGLATAAMVAPIILRVIRFGQG